MPLHFGKWHCQGNDSEVMEYIANLQDHMVGSDAVANPLCHSIFNSTLKKGNSIVSSEVDVPGWI